MKKQTFSAWFKEQYPDIPANTTRELIAARKAHESAEYALRQADQHLNTARGNSLIRDAALKAWAARG